MAELKKKEAGPLRLEALLLLQAVFAFASITFLLTSAYLKSATGSGLSAAPMPFSLIAFIVYSACLFLPRFGFLKSYRAVMILALLIFGGGGVIGNVLNYLHAGLEDYASFGIWVLAVGINLFGTIWNLLAALGIFRLGAR
jgi:hypothetical protein